MDYSKALELKKQGIGLNEIMEKLNISMNYKAFQKALWRYESKSKNNITFEDKKDIPIEEDIVSYYEKLKELEGARDKLDTKQTETTITINDNRPIAIAHWGDWHLGARGIDYKQFDEDREIIKSTEGLYWIGHGDYKDNAQPNVIPASTHESVANPSMQDLLVMNFMEEVGENNLGLIRGCHDDWDKRLGDKDFVATLCERINSVNMWHGGKVYIKLGNITYSFNVRHKYKNESSLNTTNAHRSMVNEFGVCDVEALAHLHYPDMQMIDRQGQPTIYYRSGSYKKYDEHGQKIGGYKGKWAIPTTVIFPNEKRLVPFRDIRDAVVYLKAVRGI